jgi:hypothetical protein
MTSIAKKEDVNVRMMFQIKTHRVLERSNPVGGHKDNSRRSLSRDGRRAQPLPKIYTILRVDGSSVVAELEARTGRAWRLRPPRDRTFWSDRPVYVSGPHALVIVFLERCRGG